MELYQLRIFASVAQTLNFSKTAQQFYITQPAVSQKIKQLEQEFDVTLIRRDSHHVALTKEGMALLGYASQLLDLADLAESRMKNLAEGREGHLRIAAVSSSTYELSDCLAVFSRRYPLIQVDVDLLEGPELMAALVDDSYDFYFTTARMLPEEGRYSHLVTRRSQLHLFLHRTDVPLVDMDDWSTIRDHPFVSVFRSDTALASQIEEICRNRGLRPRIINFYNRAESVIISVNAGVGLAILPSAYKHVYQRPNVVAIPIEGEDATITSVAAWDESRFSLASQRFKEVVLELFAG